MKTLLISTFLLSATVIAAEGPVTRRVSNYLENLNKREARPQILDEKLPNQVNALSRVDMIRSFDSKGNETTLTFWETNQVFRVPNSNIHMPCLENSYKARRPVTFEVDHKTNQITKCAMFGGTHPGMNSDVPRDTESATGTARPE